MKPWIGIDLDGTLAEYNGWQGPEHIGAPIEKMVERVKAWLAEGKDVRIFTARVSYPNPADLDVSTEEYAKRKNEAEIARLAINIWCARVFGRYLPITNQKDYGMVFCVDDRCKQVIPNTGVLLEEEVTWRA